MTRVEWQAFQIINQQAKTIEQLEGRVKALEGALKNICVKAFWRGSTSDLCDIAQAALAATGEEGK
jgi:hypothetical protein